MAKKLAKANEAKGEVHHEDEDEDERRGGAHPQGEVKWRRFFFANFSTFARGKKSRYEKNVAGVLSCLTSCRRVCSLL